ncbi:MAG: type II toxin-antitoxin system PemK/MazF family toxin [Rhizobiaceae bacterium]|nr:type II toxin-antitoxin system PemK/MazF family toxin [Rhizobiaceae bacterium]
MPTSDPAHALKQGDVVVVPFPYTDRLAEKRRPAVVVSSTALHARQIVWLAMVTSVENAGWPCDIRIESLEGTGLRSQSVIRPWKLATVDRSRIIRVAGQISDSENLELQKSLADALSP